MKVTEEDVAGTKRTVWIETPDGGVAVVTVDSGRAPSEVWGRSEYEFRTDVGRAALAALVAALTGEEKLGQEKFGDDLQALAAMLLAARYRDRTDATDDLHTFCQRHGIAADWSTWHSD